MQHLFVEYPLAKKLEAAGFDLPCIGYYHDETPLVDHCFWDVDKPGLSGEVMRMPIYQQVFDWLEKKNMYVSAKRMVTFYHPYIETLQYFKIWADEDENGLPLLYNTKPEAWNKAIEKALEIKKIQP